MSAAPYPELPDDLKPSVWDNMKVGHPAGADVAGMLKVLRKKHTSVAWKRSSTRLAVVPASS